MLVSWVCVFKYMLLLNYMPAQQSNKEVFAIKMFFCVSWQGKHALVVKFSFQVFVISIFFTKYG